MRWYGIFAVGLVLTVAACEDTTGPDGPDPVPHVDELVFGATSTEPGGNGMFRVQLDGSGLERVTELVPRALDVAPAGDRVAISAFDPDVSASSYDIHVVGLDGTRSNVTNDAYNDQAPAWAPDGARIAYISSRTDEFGDDGLFVVGADGSDPRLLVAPDSGWATSFAWSPAGDRVAFSFAWFDGGEVVVGTLDEEDRRLATRRGMEDRRARALDWRPDGTELVGIGPVDANGNGGIVRMYPDGSTSLSLTPTELGGFSSSVSYSPDGSRIAYVQAGRIRVIDPDGRNMVEVPLDDDMSVSSVGWLHAGSHARGR